jgi:hypothetical protein
MDIVVVEVGARQTKTFGSRDVAGAQDPFTLLHVVLKKQSKPQQAGQPPLLAKTSLYKISNNKPEVFGDWGRSVVIKRALSSFRQVFRCSSVESICPSETLPATDSVLPRLLSGKHTSEKLGPLRLHSRGRWSGLLPFQYSHVIVFTTTGPSAGLLLSQPSSRSLTLRT